MKYNEKYLKRRIERIKKRIDAYNELNGNRDTQSMTFHGGWSVGYWEGRLSAYEDMLDDLDELEDAD